MHTSDFAIETDGLRRSYETKTGWLRPKRLVIEAVRGVSFQVARGELFGLLGPNGAGKTTTIKMLNTLLLPTAGRASVLGYDVARDPVPVRRRIGYVFGGDKGLYERLSALDNLRYFAELYGVDPREQKTRIPEMLEAVGLKGREQERVEGYSRGMRQKLHIARGLLHRPEVLFLDEPTIGVDPVAGRELRAMVADLAATGITVILTTHYMAEADELCDRIAVINNGVIEAEGTPAELKDRVRKLDVVEIEVRQTLNDTHLDTLRRLPGVERLSLEPGGMTDVLQVHVRPSPEGHSAVISSLADVRTGRITTREPTLEDAYVAVIAQADDASKAPA
ncbi:ABC transporter ATP-binding protein [Streptomyces sp. NPDC055189]